MAETNNVKLLGAWPSPFVMRPRVALNLKSVQYEFVEETMRPKSELLLKSNPVHKKIPVLIHGDKPVSESLIIVEYIDEAWPSSDSSILSPDPYDRANQRFWASYVDEKWFPTVRALGNAEGEEAKKAAIEQVVEGLVLLEGAFQKSSEGKDFFGGDKIGLVDIALGSYLGWIKVFEKFNAVKFIDEDKTPGLFKWSEAFVSHDAVKSVFPDIGKLAEFALSLRALKQAGSEQ